MTAARPPPSERDRMRNQEQGSNNVRNQSTTVAEDAGRRAKARAHLRRLDVGPRACRARPEHRCDRVTAHRQRSRRLGASVVGGDGVHGRIDDDDPTLREIE